MTHPVPALLIVALTALALLGLGCAWWAISKAWRQTRRTRAGCATTATVIEVEKVSEWDGDPMCVSVVEFRDRQGRQRKARSKIAQHPAPYTVGERVEITYDPGDPTDMDIVTSATMLALAVGVGAALAGGMAWVYWGIRTGAVTFKDGNED